jgi:hypothetical protein
MDCAGQEAAQWRPMRQCHFYLFLFIFICAFSAAANSFLVLLVCARRHSNSDIYSWDNALCEPRSIAGNKCAGTAEDGIFLSFILFYFILFFRVINSGIFLLICILLALFTCFGLMLDESR